MAGEVAPSMLTAKEETDNLPKGTILIVKAHNLLRVIRPLSTMLASLVLAYYNN